MDFKSTIDSIKDGFAEGGKWIYQFIFCLIAPSYLLIYYISENLFFEIDILRLLILCAIINIVIFCSLMAIEFKINHHKDKESLSKIKKDNDERYRRVKNIEDKRDSKDITESNLHLVEEEISILNQNSINIKERVKKLEYSITNPHISIIHNVFLYEVSLCLLICLMKVYNIIFLLKPSSAEKITSVLLYFSVFYILNLLQRICSLIKKNE